MVNSVQVPETFLKDVYASTGDDDRRWCDPVVYLASYHADEIIIRR